MKNCLGIEIGHYRVKIAYMEHGELQTYVSERLETENQTDMKVYAELIKDVLKENNIRCKNAVFGFRIEIRGDFIKKQYFRISCYRAGDC